MAWPLSNLTSYLANSTPTIKAADLNAIQTAIGAILTNVYTFKALQVDGIGGNGTGLAASGEVYASGNINSALAVTGLGGVVTGTVFDASSGSTRSSGTAGAGQALTLGRIYKDTAPIAWGRISFFGGGVTFVWGVNIASVVYAAAVGVATVTLTNGPVNYLAPQGNVLSATAHQVTFEMIGVTQFKIHLFNAAGVAIEDSSVAFVVYGG